MLFLRYKKIVAMFILFGIVYILASLLAKPDPATLAHYHLSLTSDRILVLTFILPYLAIWYVALLGYLRLKSYSLSIAGSKDGHAFAIITKGVWLLVLWLPFSALFQNLASLYYTHHHEATALFVRLNNYLTVALLLAAFILLYHGSTELVRLIKSPRYSRYPQLTIGYLAFSAIYTFLTLQDSVRNHPTSGVAVSTYYEPDWLIVLTIIIPRPS